MEFEVITGTIADTLSDTWLLFVGDEGSSPTGTAATVDTLLNGHLSSLLTEQPQAGKLGEITILHTLGMVRAKRVVIAGIGKQKDINPDRIRRVAGAAVRAARQNGASTIAIDQANLYGDMNAALAAAVEGLILGSYQFTHYKTNKQTEKEIQKIFVATLADVNILSIALQRAEIIANSVLFARDLVNHPSNVMTPSAMAERALEIGQTNGLEVRILEKTDIKNLKMNAFLAVAKGSQEPPRMLVLTYTGNPPAEEYVAFIGKGVTFDSGGISLKPSEGMDEMKTDMAGGAAVLGAMKAIAALKLKVNILGIVPCAENMPSGCALKPGDVITSMAGKTIEVVNTDAEGRLLLVDAVTYAKQLGAAKLVDLATLTGACVVALGSYTSGVIANQDDWCDQVLEAAVQCGEKMWRLPSYDDYKEQIKSPVADMKNSGGRPAGAITAGLFIAEFAGETPWVHIDIAGTATVNKDSGYQVKGATGAGVRTLIQLATNLSKQ